MILFMSAQSFADLTDTASLFLAGYIQLHFDLRVQPAMNNIANMDLENGETSLKVADVLESSNLVSGYTISLESVNAGSLLHNNGTSAAAYEIQYGASGSFVSVPAVGSPTIVKSSGVLPGLSFAIEEVFFRVPANPSLIGGAYTDTLIFSIQAL